MNPEIVELMSSASERFRELSDIFTKLSLAVSDVVQTAPVQTAPVQTAPVQTASVQTAPVQSKGDQRQLLMSVGAKILKLKGQTVALDILKAVGATKFSLVPDDMVAECIRLCNAALGE